MKAFAEAAGTLVARDARARVGVRELGLGVREAPAGERAAGTGGRRAAAGDFYCPGALLGVLTTPDPLTAGMDESGAIWFGDSPAFETGTGKVVAAFARKDPLLSGWVLGGREIFWKAGPGEG